MRATGKARSQRSSAVRMSLSSGDSEGSHWHAWRARCPVAATTKFHAVHASHHLGKGVGEGGAGGWG
jgi:hypothetical protein